MPLLHPGQPDLRVISGGVRVININRRLPLEGLIQHSFWGAESLYIRRPSGPLDNFSFSPSYSSHPLYVEAIHSIIWLILALHHRARQRYMPCASTTRSLMLGTISRLTSPACAGSHKTATTPTTSKSRTSWATSHSPRTPYELGGSTGNNRPGNGGAT